MGKYAAAAIAHNILDNSNSIKGEKLISSYSPPKEDVLCPKLKRVMRILRKEVELSYEEIVYLENFLKSKKTELEEKLQKQTASSKRTDKNPTINYSQKKIGNRFYWYKQYTKDGKNVTEYVKNINTEKIDISKATISFHPDFNPEKK